MGLRPLVSATSALLVTVYAVCVAAAVRLLPRGSRHRTAALTAAAAVLAMLVMTGLYLAVPVSLLAIATVSRRVRPGAPGRTSRGTWRTKPDQSARLQ
jgi:amino acid efflux transporter